jgi:nucleoside-diphosphate-sugar epimerase
MRVAVTGATGFLGGALARALASEGVEVHALARHGADRRLLADVPITWHRGDVTEPETLPPLLAGADAVVHAAGRLGEAGLPDAAYRAVNVAGTRHLLDAAFADGRRPRVLHLSSTGVLGPIAGPSATERAPLAPNTPYERSKAEAERIALDFARRGLPVIVARPGFVYGPGDRHVLGLFRAIARGHFFYMGGARARCQPTFVDDAVAGMLLCLRRGRPGEVYHLAGPRPVTFRELGDTIAGALGVRHPWLDVPVWLAWTGAATLELVARAARRRPPFGRTAVAFFTEDRHYSCRKACEELGFSPRHDLRSGARTTVDWYRASGWL